MRGKRNKKLLSAKNMPPLYHTLPGKEFSFSKSEVMKWISKNPFLILYLFEKVCNHEIVYDPDTGKWQGVDYDDEN